MKTALATQPVTIGLVLLLQIVMHKIKIFCPGLKRVFALQEASDRKLQMKIEIIGDLCDLKKKCTGQHNGYWWGVWDFVVSTY